jgi:hypothetical protein
MLSQLPNEVISLISQYTGPYTEHIKQFSELIYNYIRQPNEEHKEYFHEEILTTIWSFCEYRIYLKLKKELTYYFKSIGIMGNLIDYILTTPHEHRLEIFTHSNERFIIWYRPDENLYRIVVTHSDDYGRTISLRERLTQNNITYYTNIIGGIHDVDAVYIPSYDTCLLRLLLTVSIVQTLE